jgi:hypothetical protein
MPEAEPESKATDWDELLKKATGREKTVSAVTFVRRRADTASHPVYVVCDDSKTYVVKPLRNDAEQGRMLFTDQIVARFGGLIGVAVPRVSLVTISQALIDLNPHPQQGLGHCKAGISHGSELLKDVTERIDLFQHVADDDNRNRFSSLGVLHGWLSPSDRQFLYEVADPFRVWAVDHGHFFPNGPNWSPATLTNAGPPQVAADLIAACSFSSDELNAACSILAKITDEEIGRILAIPPEGWGVKVDERIGLAKYLSARRDAMLKAYETKKAGQP